jgi:hypothetical protein
MKMKSRTGNAPQKDSWMALAVFYNSSNSAREIVSWIG